MTHVLHDDPSQDAMFARVTSSHGWTPTKTGDDWVRVKESGEGYDTHSDGAPDAMPQCIFYPSTDGVAGVLVIHLGPRLVYVATDDGAVVSLPANLMPDTAWTTLIGRTLSSITDHPLMTDVRVTGLDHRRDADGWKVDLRIDVPLGG